MTSANDQTFCSSRISTKNRRSRLTALSLIWFLWDVKDPDPISDPKIDIFHTRFSDLVQAEIMLSLPDIAGTSSWCPHQRESVIVGVYFSQTTIIYFCPGFRCCPYYWGVCYSGVSARRELTVLRLKRQEKDFLRSTSNSHYYSFFLIHLELKRPREKRHIRSCIPSKTIPAFRPK